MASKFYMTIEGTKQGKFKGGSTQKGKGALSYSDGMECHGFSYQVVAPIDPATGQPVGRRRHNPIKITKDTDSASPLLLQTLAMNENFIPEIPLTGSSSGSGGSGSSSGNPHVVPIVVKKKTDEASPLLWQALASNEGFISAFPLTGSSGSSHGSGGSGSSSGKRRHGPIVVTKETDAASPLFFQAVAMNELLKTVKITWSQDGNGRARVWHVVELSYAVIEKINRVCIPGAKTHGEEIEFAYLKLEIKNEFS